MLKNILNLEGAQQLSKNEQQSIQGGKDPKWCQSQPPCTVCGGTPEYQCWNGACVHEDEIGGAC